LFFEDARAAINDCFYTEVVFADDLNAYRVFPSDFDNADIKTNLETCQKELHEWGAANQVAFDAGKESQHILSLSSPMGAGFKLLGVSFDEELAMADAISELVSTASWKLKTLLRTRRFYSDADLILLYKAHLLSFIEYRTPAIYHATRDVLCRLDDVQKKFLRNVSVDEVTALAEFHLAPLSVRRDLAMLGLIHRTMLGKGPPQFAEHFKLDGSRHKSLHDPRKDCKSPLIKRSALGLIAVYNLLPSHVVAARSVKEFQRGLQHIVCKAAQSEHPRWREMLSPRVSLETHPLVSIF